jgi:hypothetical protein
MNDSPEVVMIALVFRRNHPQVPPLDILEACFRHRAGGHVSALGDALPPGSQFAQMVCEAFVCTVIQEARRQLAQSFNLVLS